MYWFRKRRNCWIILIYESCEATLVELRTYNFYCQYTVACTVKLSKENNIPLHNLLLCIPLVYVYCRV